MGYDYALLRVPPISNTIPNLHNAVVYKGKDIVYCIRSVHE